MRRSNPGDRRHALHAGARRRRRLPVLAQEANAHDRVGEAAHLAVPGLTVGEPPSTRGYTPSVFALFPRLLERAGPGTRGTITGIYTVLVDGDDMNEPVGDAVRGILDGHIVLSRKLAHANHFPAIDILQSVSRVMSRVTSAEDRATADEARRLLAAYRDAEDLIRVGAYARGANAEIDRAVAANDALNAFLRQTVSEPSAADVVGQLRKALAGNDAKAA